MERERKVRRKGEEWNCGGEVVDGRRKWEGGRHRQRKEKGGEEKGEEKEGGEEGVREGRRVVFVEMGEK